MKVAEILVLYGLSVVVNGVWWTAAVQPVIMSIGAVFTALNLDLDPILDSLTFKNDKEAGPAAAKEKSLSDQRWDEE